MGSIFSNVYTIIERSFSVKLTFTFISKIHDLNSCKQLTLNFENLFFFSFFFINDGSCSGYPKLKRVKNLWVGLDIPTSDSMVTNPTFTN